MMAAEHLGFDADFQEAIADAERHITSGTAAPRAEHASWLTSKRASKNTLSRKKWAVSATSGSAGEKWYQFKAGVLTVHDTIGGEATLTVKLPDIVSVTMPDPTKPSCSFAIVTKEKTHDLLCRTEEDCAVWYATLSHALGPQDGKAKSR